MSSSIVHPPRTAMEVFESLPEGTLIQVVKNNLVMSPVPTDPHQKMISKLHLKIGGFIEQNNLGETRVAPYDVYLDQENAFQPDIIFISNENLHLIQKNGLHGAPDLVIEILSPSTAKYDRGEKKEMYEKSGVKEYWIVDPSDHSVQGYQLIKGFFVELPPAQGLIRSILLKEDFRF